MSDSIAPLQLLSTQGIGPKTISRVMEALSADGARPGDLLELGVQDLLKLGLELEQAEGFRAGREAALRLEEELDRRDVRILARGDGAYPSRLSEVLGPSAPPILTATGNLSLLGSPGVAFCGSRNASTAGLELAAAVADDAAAPRGESGVPALLKLGARELPRRSDGALDCAKLVNGESTPDSNSPASKVPRKQRELFGT